MNRYRTYKFMRAFKMGPDYLAQRFHFGGGELLLRFGIVLVV